MSDELKCKNIASSQQEPQNCDSLNDNDDHKEATAGLAKTSDEADESVSSSHGLSTPQKWNEPRVNTFRIAAALYSFVVMGMSDASYGALIPYVRRRTSSIFSSTVTIRMLTFSSARSVLPRRLYDHFSRLLSAVRRIHHRCFHERSRAQSLRTARRCFRGAAREADRVRRDLQSCAVSSAACHLHFLRVRC